MRAEDDGDRARGMQGGVGIVGARGHDEVDPEPHEVGGEVRDALVLTAGQPVLDSRLRPSIHPRVRNPSCRASRAGEGPCER